ncbi:MAG: AraC family transcriptional regulator [Pseudomonas sp.]|nr:AraC family transcriptional regulator [Pseudomonas sp.]
MKEQVHYRRAPNMPGLVLSEARFSEFRFDPHYHLDYHIGLVPDGIQRQTFNGHSVLLGPGRISVMPPGQIHDGAGADGEAYTMTTFRLSSVLVDRFSEEITGVRGEAQWAGSMIENPRLSRDLLWLHRAMQQDCAPLAVDGHWLQLLERLLQQTSAIRPQVVEGGLSLAHWLQVRDYCHAHLIQSITLEQLAGLCDLSRFQFLRRFKHSVGMTPHAWLVRLRLERACLLLAQPHSSIVEVALAVGFYDQSHFNRAFRQAYGVAPSAY